MISRRDPAAIGAAMAFEDEVRRVAEAVWGLDPGECQPAWYRSDPVLHELDAIARLRDLTHVVMVTTSLRLDKVRDDVGKLNAAAKQESKRGNPVEKWLITEQQLGAEQIEHAKRADVRVMTLAQFRNRFFNGRDYITKRKRASFGSARNLEDGSITIPDDEYVQLPMIAVDSFDRSSATERGIDLDDLARLLSAGHWVVLVGPYGAGKSLTIREIFSRLAQRHLKDDRSTPQVPIAVNLREHWGAQYADEVLDRHARSLGVTPRENLTIAWRAGLGTLLLDGFDEVASQAIATPAERDFMKAARREALRAVKDLISKLPSGVGMLIAGRDHYFDDRSELESALGLAGRRYVYVRLEEFTESQAGEYLGRHGKPMVLPDWLPRKPLILGYLAHRNLLDAVLAIDGTQGFGLIWSQFLDLITEREAEHERSVMEPRTIRRVLERLACTSRAATSGNGPLSGLDLAEAYRAETGNTAGEGVLMQLQRLPGLTPREQDPASRSFVDEDLLAALQGSAVARAVIENTGDIADRRWSGPLSPNGVRIAVHLIRAAELDAAAVMATAGRFASLDTSASGATAQLAADAVSVALGLAVDDGSVDGYGLTVSNAEFGLLDIEEVRVGSLALSGCLIQELVIGPNIATTGLRFKQCAIGKVSGVGSAQALPREVFLNCDFGDFDDTSTNAAVMKLDIPPGLKALMTVLRKLYLQPGGGRKLAALRRGVPPGPIYDAVPEVLRTLEGEGMVSIVGEVAHPIRKHGPRVRQILAAGELSEDGVVARFRDAN